jgi:hypothetical protein
LDGCPCYSLEPSCSEILGRDTEYLFKKDGTRVSFPLTQIIRDEESVLNGQLVQNVDGKVVIRVEPLQSEITLNRILNSFHRRLPDIEVEVVDCEKIERTPTGKFVSFLNNYQNSEGQTN